MNRRIPLIAAALVLSAAALGAPGNASRAAAAAGAGVPADAAPGALTPRSMAQPAQLPVAAPRHELRGHWQIGRIRYRFSRSGGLHRARTVAPARVGKCRIGRGTIVFSGYRFVSSRGSTDLWRGRVTLPGPDCRRRAAPGRIVVASDLRFELHSSLPGLPRTVAARRIRPTVRADDPVLGTWTLNDADVAVQLAAGRYEGIASEPFLIANGCTIEAGTILWVMRPLAPGRYDGTVERFRTPPACARDVAAPSRWVLSPAGDELVREDPQGNRFSYKRAAGATAGAALKKP